jgi:hypothetical protein
MVQQVFVVGTFALSSNHMPCASTFAVTKKSGKVHWLKDDEVTIVADKLNITLLANRTYVFKFVDTNELM